MKKPVRETSLIFQPHLSSPGVPYFITSSICVWGWRRESEMWRAGQPPPLFFIFFVSTPILFRLRKNRAGTLLFSILANQQIFRSKGIDHLILFWRQGSRISGWSRVRNPGSAGVGVGWTHERWFSYFLINKDVLQDWILVDYISYFIRSIFPLLLRTPSSPLISCFFDYPQLWFKNPITKRAEIQIQG